MNGIILILSVVLLGALALFVLDRLLLWMERRGWIYYRKRSGSGSSVGNAFLEIQSMIEPNKKEILEEMREDKTEQAESGAPPEPGSKD